MAACSFTTAKSFMRLADLHEAIPAFEKALTMPIEMHDRVLWRFNMAGYAAMAAFDQTKDAIS
jgi:hypothetical protein